MIKVLINKDNELMSSDGREYSGEDDIFKIENLKLIFRKQKVNTTYIYIISKVINDQTFYKIGTTQSQTYGSNSKRGRLSEAQTFLIPGLKDIGFKVHYLFFYYDKPKDTSSISLIIEKQLHNVLRLKFKYSVIKFPTYISSEWYLPGRDCEIHFFGFIFDCLSYPSSKKYLIEGWKLLPVDYNKFSESNEQIRNHLPLDDELKYRYPIIQDSYTRAMEANIRSSLIPTTTQKAYISTPIENSSPYGSLEEYKKYYNDHNLFDYKNKNFKIVEINKHKGKKRSKEEYQLFVYGQIYCKIEFNEIETSLNDFSIFPQYILDISNNKYAYLHISKILEYTRDGSDSWIFERYYQTHRDSPSIAVVPIREYKLAPLWMDSIEKKKEYAYIYTKSDFPHIWHHDKNKIWKIIGSNITDDSVTISREQYDTKNGEVIKNNDGISIVEELDTIYYMILFNSKYNSIDKNSNINIKTKGDKIKLIDSWNSPNGITFKKSDCISVKNFFFPYNKIEDLGDDYDTIEQDNIHTIICMIDEIFLDYVDNKEKMTFFEIENKLPNNYSINLESFDDNQIKLIDNENCPKINKKKRKRQIKINFGKCAKYVIGAIIKVLKKGKDSLLPEYGEEEYYMKIIRIERLEKKDIYHCIFPKPFELRNNWTKKTNLEKLFVYEFDADSHFHNTTVKASKLEKKKYIKKNSFESYEMIMKKNKKYIGRNIKKKFDDKNYNGEIKKLRINPKNGELLFYVKYDDDDDEDMNINEIKSYLNNDEYIGRRVSKSFRKKKFKGTIKDYWTNKTDGEILFNIEYDDGDEEDLNFEDVKKILI